MDFLDSIPAKGELDIVVRDIAGNIKQELHAHNLVVTTGKVYIASRIASNSTAIMSNMAIGTGTTSPTVGDTTLATEAGRVTMTSFSASSNVVTATATFAAGTGTGAITEAGIFNAASSGSMLCRTTFPVVNKGASDSISITWTVTIG